MKSIIEEKEKIRKLLFNKFLKEKLSKNNEKLINEYVNLIYDEISRIEKVSTEKSNWHNSSMLFVLGIFLGVTTNLFSNIIDNFLKPYSLGYIIFVILLLIFNIREAFKIINNPYNPTQETIDDFYKEFSDQINNDLIKNK